MVDALIRLFPKETTTVNPRTGPIGEQDPNPFLTNGIGVLVDAESCKVKEEDNGEFELEMVYPINGRYYSSITLGSIIVVKTYPDSDKPQAFRIYSFSKPISGKVTINAHHISYDLSGYPIKPFSLTGQEGVNTIATIFDNINNNTDGTNNELDDIWVAGSLPFWFSVEGKTNSGDFKMEKPMSLRSLLGGVEGSILSRFGKGDYIFDNFDVKLVLNRGSDRGVTIRYGKNLTDLKQEENNSSVYTHVYPFWLSSGMEETAKEYVSGTKIQVNENLQNVERENILTLDLSADFAEKPTSNDLDTKALEYIGNHQLASPEVSLTVSFEQLSQSDDYEQYSALEEVKLGDTVTVVFPELGVSSTAKCISTEYDVLTNKYIKIELGDAKPTLAKTISSQGQKIDSAATVSDVQDINKQTIAGLGFEVGIKIEEGNEVTYIRTNDAGNGSSYDNPANFEIDTYKDENGNKTSELNVETMNLASPVFKSDVVSETAVYAGPEFYCGEIFIKNNIIYDSLDDKPFVYLIDGISVIEITAKITVTNRTTQPSIITISLYYKDTEQPYTTLNTVVFQVNVHSRGGKWNIFSISVLSGQSSNYITIPAGIALLGVKEAVFISNGKATFDYTSPTEKYLSLGRSLSPYDDYAFGYDLGSPDKRWRTIYGHQYYQDSSPISTSDRNAKKDISYDMSIYDVLFDKLNPVSYRFIENESGRIHLGFIAQDVKEAMDELDIPSSDFAGYCEIKKEKDKTMCGLRYEEFIALNTYEIQKLKKKIKELEEQLTKQ